jgi:hypothetical protein
MKPTFFRTPAEFRRWLARHHATAAELLVGYYKKGSGRPSITWPESVDEALCFGWIDGVRKSVDAISYAIRFTPRRKVPGPAKLTNGFRERACAPSLSCDGKAIPRPRRGPALRVCGDDAEPLSEAMGDPMFGSRGSATSAGRVPILAVSSTAREGSSYP